MTIDARSARISVFNHNLHHMKQYYRDYRFTNLVPYSDTKTQRDKVKFTMSAVARNSDMFDGLPFIVDLNTPMGTENSNSWGSNRTENVWFYADDYVIRLTTHVEPIYLNGQPFILRLGVYDYFMNTIISYDMRGLSGSNYPVHDTPVSQKDLQIRLAEVIDRDRAKRLEYMTMLNIANTHGS